MPPPDSRRRRALTEEAASSLIEVVVAAALLVATLAPLSALLLSVAQSRANERLALAIAVAQAAVERARGDCATPPSGPDAGPGLAHGSAPDPDAARWRIHLAADSTAGVAAVTVRVAATRSGLPLATLTAPCLPSAEPPPTRAASPSSRS